MNQETGCCSRTTLNGVGVVGAFVFMAVLVAALKYYTSISPVNQVRAEERRKILSEAREKAAIELATVGWVDQQKGIVRLPNDVAMSLAVKQWQDPAKARAELIARAEKAFFVPPPPPEKPSEFE